MLLHAPAPVTPISLQSGVGYVRAIRTPTRGTILTHMRADSPLRIFSPCVGCPTAWVVTSTLGGGLVGGDDIRLSLDVEAGASVLLTTQASTKAYRSTRPTRQCLATRVADAGLLVVLPDPIVGFAGSTFEQQQVYELADRASLLALDWMVSGRRASGERWAFDGYVSRFQIAREGRPVFYDHLRLSQTDGPVIERMRAFHSYAVAVVTGPVLAPLADRILTTVSSAAVERDSDVLMSAAPLSGGDGVVVRMASVSGERLSATLRESFRPIVPILGEDPWARRW